MPTQSDFAKPFEGMSLSMAIIPSCSELIEASRRERVQDQATNFISGWMNSVVFLGEFLGPFIGGYLIEYAQENIRVWISDSFMWTRI